MYCAVVHCSVLYSSTPHYTIPSCFLIAYASLFCILCIGCGIVEFSSPLDAQRAINQLNDTPLLGRMIFVREDREENDNRGFDRGNGADRGNSHRHVQMSQGGQGQVSYTDAVLLDFTPAYLITFIWHPYTHTHTYTHRHLNTHPYAQIYYMPCCHLNNL